MNKLFTLLALGMFALSANAQSPTSANTPIKETQPYGQVDTADLTMKACDFEKDANAEVLFDKGEISFRDYGEINLSRHRRIKIFNDTGKDEANIKFTTYDDISDITAETINLNGTIIEYTPVDSKLIYKQKDKKGKKIISFAFPNVKSGSVIEFKYNWKSIYFLPTWDFQSSIPTRYSEISVSKVNSSKIRTIIRINQFYSKITNDTLGNKQSPWGSKITRGLSKIPSTKDEPYTSLLLDNTQKLIFKFPKDEWIYVAGHLFNNENFGAQLLDNLTGEKEILDSIATLKTNDLKIDSIFRLVKNRVHWDKTDNLYTVDGLQNAWNKKRGNATEINLITYHLLKRAGIKAYPMLINIHDNGRIDTSDASLYQLDRAVIFVPLDSIHYYLLDVTGKYNTYKQTPLTALGIYGLIIDPKTYDYRLFAIQSNTPTKQLVFINAEIKPDGKMSGTAQIISDSYYRIDHLMQYDDLGEKKYIDDLAENNNDLKITSLKLEDAETDTVPLTQHIDFNFNLSTSDGNYIYFNPNLFTGLRSNPFLSETRNGPVDFRYNSTNTISGIYKIPDGYKVDALPQNQTITMPDKGISFKRLMVEQNGTVQVNYTISRKKTFYSKAEYPALFEFYKKMFEMLNEQIALKKT